MALEIFDHRQQDVNKRFFELDRAACFSHLNYLLRVILGVIVCFIFYKSIPQYPFYWSPVSVVLATSVDNSSNQAYDRIKANVLGCLVGISLNPVDLPELLVLCLGAVIIVFLAIGLRITGTVRSALAAFIIVTIQVGQTKHWVIALERVLCVVTGCLVALLLTLIFKRLRPKAAKGRGAEEI